MIQLIKLKIMLFEAAKVRNFQNLSTFAGQNRARSLMDKIKECITNFQKLNSWVIYSVKSTIS